MYLFDSVHYSNGIALAKRFAVDKQHHHDAVWRKG
jgi:hypothetical protein